MVLPSLFRRERSRAVPIRREPAPVAALHDELDRLVAEFFGRRPGGGFGPDWLASEWGGFAPAVDVDESEEEVRVTAELPGLDEKDFELSLDRETLTLRGEKKHASEEQRGAWTRSERFYGRFERRIALPCEVDVDGARAELRQGVLQVTLPKDPAARRRRVQIPVRAA